MRYVEITTWVVPQVLWRVSENSGLSKKADGFPPFLGQLPAWLLRPSGLSDLHFCDDQLPPFMVFHRNIVGKYHDLHSYQDCSC